MKDVGVQQRNRSCMEIPGVASKAVTTSRQADEWAGREDVTHFSCSAGGDDDHER